MLLSWPVDVPTLSGERVTLRPWREEDAPAVFAACQDQEIQRWTNVPAPYLPEHAASFVSDFAREQWMAGLGAAFCVAAPPDDAVLGSCSLMDVDARHLVAEVGYWVAPWARQQGAASSALASLSTWALGDLGLARLELYIEPENHPSVRVAERCGFKLEGVMQRKVLIRNERRDFAGYAQVR
jgi:RimJ/RimL family protein N-acetyltransferase